MIASTSSASTAATTYDAPPDTRRQGRPGGKALESPESPPWPPFFELPFVFELRPKTSPPPSRGVAAEGNAETPASSPGETTASGSSSSFSCPSGHEKSTTYVLADALSGLGEDWDWEPPRAASHTRSSAPNLSTPRPESASSSFSSSPRSPPFATSSTRPTPMALCAPLLASTAALTCFAAARTAKVASSCASAAAHPAGSAAASSAASARVFRSAAASSASLARSSRIPLCAWNSANERASISSTRKSSTRMRFRIMPYVSLNCDSSLVARPVSSARLRLRREVFPGGDDHRAHRVEAAAPGAAGHLRVLARGQTAEVGPVVLAQVLEAHAARGRVDAHGEGLRREQRLDHTAAKQHLDDFLHDGEQPGVVHAEAAPGGARARGAPAAACGRSGTGGSNNAHRRRVCRASPRSSLNPNRSASPPSRRTDAWKTQTSPSAGARGARARESAPPTRSCPDRARP